ncbi:MAG: N-acyl-D-amino-acid deacylase [Micromonosporaceae bacterium]
MFDLLVRDAWVLDGTGAPALRADIGVRDGRIGALGRLAAAQAARVIEAAGRYVLPGFIDTHAHGDSAVLDPATQLAALSQGVTTLVLGQDGLSYAPASPSTVEFVERYFAAVNGPRPAFAAGADRPLRVSDLLAGYTGGTALNTAYLVPHGTIRYEVLGAAARRPDGEELSRMLGLVEQALGDGAVGLSTGLEYAPGRYADAAELAYLCQPLGALPYVTHMRGYEDRAAGAMAEVTTIARTAGVAAHVSHYHGPAGQLVPLVDRARDEGLDVTFDSYPYLRGSSILALVTLPDWLPTADAEATCAALRDEDVRRRLRAGWPDELWSGVTLSHVPHPDWRWTEGLRVAEAARRVGRAPQDVALDLLTATRLEVGCVFDQPPTNSEESVRALLRHPAHMTGSDGIYQGGHPHPRGYGTFARMLSRYVRELGDWSWEQAAVHLAGHPARRFGLAGNRASPVTGSASVAGRGLLRTGFAADLSVLDPAAVAERATYEAPRTPAGGVSHVVVGGVVVFENGALTGATPGRALRP